MTYEIKNHGDKIPLFVLEAYQNQTPQWCIEKYFKYLKKKTKTYLDDDVVAGGACLYHFKFDFLPEAEAESEAEEEDPQN